MEKKYLYIGGAAVIGLGAYLWYSGHMAEENAAATAQTDAANNAASSQPTLLYEPSSATGGTDQTDAANASTGASGGTDGGLASIGGTSTASDSDIVSLLGQQISGQNANQALALNLQSQTNDLALSTGLQGTDAGDLSQLLASLSGRASGATITNSSNGVSIALQNLDATLSPVNGAVGAVAAASASMVTPNQTDLNYLNSWYSGTPTYTPVDAGAASNPNGYASVATGTGAVAVTSNPTSGLHGSIK